MTERWTLESIASDLWATDYEQLFNIEIERNRQLQSSIGTSGLTGQQQQLSSRYARRLSGHAREAWEHKQLIREPGSPKNDEQSYYNYYVLPQ